MVARRNYSISLIRLLKGIAQVPAVLDTQIHGIKTDSREVISGDLFLSLSSNPEHTRAHILDAVARGANAVVADASLNVRRVNEEGGAVEIFIENLRSLMGEIAARFFQYPSRDIAVVGITGTNGKTSVSHYIADYLSRDGALCGVIGTLGYGIPSLDGANLKQTGFTTPDVVAVHRSLASLRDRGAKFVAMEASSHGIEQARIAGVEFVGAVFTNLSREHMDYHGTMENYGAAKRRLFLLPGLRFAVLNGDDAYTPQIVSKLAPNVKLLRYGFKASNEIHVNQAQYERGIAAQVHTPLGDIPIESPLLGEFNLSNLMAVIGVALSLGRSLSSLTVLAELKPVSGRMQLIRSASGPAAVVDFAHTPDALEKVLLSLKRHCQGRLVVVFGCGGNRDRGKRPEMARIAEQLADEVWVTSDNPRNEGAEDIIAEIMGGFTQAERVKIQPDRALAIAAAIAHSSAQDLILIAGKGHETWQEINGQKTYFNDAEQVEAALRNWQIAGSQESTQ